MLLLVGSAHYRQQNANLHCRQIPGEKQKQKQKTDFEPCGLQDSSNTVLEGVDQLSVSLSFGIDSLY